MRASARMLPGTLRSEIAIRRGAFRILTDEPESVGGEDTAPAPHELLPAALASCVATTLTMYARTKEWELGEVAVDVNFHARETPPRFEVEISVGADLSEEQLHRLEKVAASCPVQRSLVGGARFEERIVSAAGV